MAPSVKGMVLAAGFGTRLRPLTDLYAKPAIPFLNRPLIQYSLELLAEAGIQDIVVNLHHLPESVRQAVGQPENPVFFSYENPIQGTAGALAQVRHWLAGHRILLVNGKIYFEEDLSDVLRFHHESKALATLVLVPKRADDPFLPVLVDRDNQIRDFVRSHRFDLNFEGEHLRPFTFTGVHVLEPEVLDYIPDGPSDSVRDLYPRLIGQGLPIRGFVSDRYWCECSTSERYLQKSLELLRRRKLPNLPWGKFDSSCRNSILAGDFQVHPEAELRDCVVWGGTSVDSASRFDQVVLAGGLSIGEPARRYSNCVLTPRSVLPEHRLPEGVEVQKDCLVWPFQSEPFARMGIVTS